MREFDGIAGFERAIGDHLGYSASIPITQELIDRFADVTGDHQWIHVDIDRAAHGPFGGTIAHGYLALSLLPRMLWQIYRLDDVSMEINYGLNRVRFPAALPVGARIRAGASLRALTHAERGATAVLDVEVDIQGLDKPACVAELLVLIRP